MFSSLKLNSLKCQSNSANEKKKDKCDDNDEDDDNVSEHMYEKLPNYDTKTCKCHSNYISRSPKTLKTSFSKRISKWRMECPTITRISRPDEEFIPKNNQGDKRNLFSPKISNILKPKITTVCIEREDGNLGITLRGGFQPNPELSKPVVITYVKPDGPASREGTIKCGDRVLAVDGVPLQGKSLSEAQTLLRQSTPSTLLTIEYDVNVLDSVEHATGPLLIEIELNSFEELGIKLSQSENGLVAVESIKPGSRGDRCGAIHVGDEILAINSTRVDCPGLKLEEIEKYIEISCPVIRLEILPYYATMTYSDIGTWRSKDHLLASGSSLSGVSTLRSNASRRNHDRKSPDLSHDFDNILDLKSPAINPTSFHSSNMALTHSETIHTTIYRENGSFGIECADIPNGAIIISRVINGSPAERSQCLHPGDRVLSINNRNLAGESLNAKDINGLLEGKSEKSLMKLILHTEFDVLDSVVPASGIFTVKLAKRGTSGLGITITASKSSGFTVCEMKKGSIAYRSGSLVPGDKILAINNIPLNQCSAEFAAHILHQSSKIVILRVQRRENISDTKNIRKVNYTVELQRYGGPLGITIAGSEEPFHPITISGLSSGGLAEQTGALHIGDEILAINDHSLYGEPLSKAHHLLQNSPDFVTLKISKLITQYSRLSNNIDSTLPSSGDNSIEFWGKLDMGTPLDYHQITLKEPKECGTQSRQLWSPPGALYSDELQNDSRDTRANSDLPDLSLLDEITSQNLKIKKELDLLSFKLDAECKLNMKNVNNTEEKGDDHESETKLESSDSTIQNFKSSNSHNLCLDDKKDDSKSEINVDFHCVDSPKVSNIYKDIAKQFDDQSRESFMTNDFENLEIAYLSDSKNWLKSHYLGNECNSDSIRNNFHNSQLYKITLYKDPIYEDFGFSVSDGLYERGVFVNRIRKGGPADLNSVLKPYDRILQVNETFTQDFDCCLTVPLIASAGDSITLLVARTNGNYSSENVSFCTVGQDSVQVLEEETQCRKEYGGPQNSMPVETDLDGTRRILV